MKKLHVKATIKLLLSLVISIISIQFLIVPVSKLQLETSFISIPLIIILLILSIVGFMMIFLKQHVIHQVSDWLTFFTLSFLSVMFVFSFVILPSNVNQSSMFPTLASGDRIIIYHYQYETTLNDIVVIEMRQDVYPQVPNSSFIDPQTQDTTDFVYYVKRVYGMEGDIITFVRTSFNSEQFHIFINGVQLFSTSQVAYTLTFLQKLALEDQLEGQTIPDDFVFVLGDNALSSLDSRAFGLVRDQDIMGKVIFKLWPFGGVS